MILALTLAIRLAAQEPPIEEFRPGDPFSVEIRADDPLLHGHGPSRTFGFTAESEGVLFLWASSQELDPFLRISTSDGSSLGEDEDSGGSTTACLTLPVQEGDVLRIQVASSGKSDAGKVTVSVVLEPKTQAVLHAIETARERLAEIERRLAAREFTGLSTILESVAKSLDEAAGDDGNALLEQSYEDLSNRARALDDRNLALIAMQALLETKVRCLPPTHRDVLAVKGNLASGYRDHGRLQEARALEEEVLEQLESTLPDDDPVVLMALRNLSRTLRDLGELENAKGLLERTLAAQQGKLSEADPALITTRSLLARVLSRMNDLEGTRALEAEILRIQEATLPEDHRELQVARINFAVTLKSLGELDLAQKLEEQTLASFERTLPPGHGNLRLVRGNLANTLRDQGDLQGARELREQIVMVLEAEVPEDHQDLQAARGNLSSVMYAQGDIAGSLALRKRIFDVQRTVLPEGDMRLQWARVNLGSALQQVGDLAASEELLRVALEHCTRNLPSRDPSLQLVRLNYALVLRRLGRTERALVLAELALEELRRHGSVDPDRMLHALTSTASIRQDLGRHEAAAVLLREGMSLASESLSETDSNFLAIRLTLSFTYRAMGDCERAIEQEKLVLAALKDLPGSEGLRWRCTAREYLCWNLLALEEWSELSAQLALLQQDTSEMLLEMRQYGQREIGERLGRLRATTESLLSLTTYLDVDAALRTRTFELLETARALGSLAVRPVEESDSREVRSLTQGIRELRERSNDLVAAEGGTEEARKELVDVTLQLDRAEEALRQELGFGDAARVEIRARAIADALSRDGAVVTYRVYSRWRIDPERRHAASPEESLVAHVVLPDASVTRIELGSVAPLVEAVDRWREGLGPVEGRGVGAGEASSPPTVGEGARIRSLVLDPILDVVGSQSQLHVCPDGPLHMIPLDALPRGESLVGDSVSLHTEVSLARLIDRRPESSGSGTFLAVGGVDFDSAAKASRTSSTVRSPPLAFTLERGHAARFETLLGTDLEVRMLGGLFQETFGKEPSLLQGSLASKDRIHELSPGSRFVHFATHGYFASEAMSVPHPGSVPGSPSLVGTARYLAPLTLCGLAFAGANLGVDEVGRVPGIMTAEEIATLDLAECELAVLSACETNVGIHRSGQGLASLQKALHMAGARSVITSLWKVSDEVTQELMVEFYRRMWVEEEPKWKALWGAKMHVRERGAGLVDWAGWVLTGNPD